MKTNRIALNLALRLLVSAICTFAISGCGVRGRPQPPLTPAELGRGEPGFKRASEEFAFPDIPAPAPVPAPAPTSQPKSREEGR